MSHFTPLPALAGGALIGLSALLLMLLNGRIAGISGILGGLLSAGAQDRAWRLAFLAGLIAAPLILTRMGAGGLEPVMPQSWLTIIVAGALVGFGTRAAGGCTSGHGICGNARLSPRSMVATVTFMATAIIVVAITHHLV